MYNDRMKAPRPAFRWLYIILPLLAGLILGIYPVSRLGPNLAEAARQAALDGSPGRMASAYEALARLSPSLAQFWENAGQAALDAGQPAEAARLLMEARSRSALSNDGLWVLGDAFRQTGQLEDALQAWEQAAASGPASASRYQTLTNAYIEAGDMENAAVSVRSWRELDLKSPEAAYLCGLILAVADPGQAHTCFLAAGELDTTLLQNITRVENGIAAALLEQDPAYRLAVIGQALGSVDEWQIAAAAFERSTLTNPGYPEAWALLGEARQHLGGDGGEEISRALALDPDSFLSLSLAALRCQRRQEWSQAVGYLDIIATQDPDNPRWLVELGAANAGLGDLETAYQNYAAAVKLDPQDASLWRLLAAFSLSSNYQLDSVGFPAARQAVQLAPQDPASLDTLARVYMATGDLVSAEKFLQKAISTGSDYAMAYLHLGMVLQDLGRTEEARTALERAVMLAPQDQAGVQARRLLEETSP